MKYWHVGKPVSIRRLQYRKIDVRRRSFSRYRQSPPNDPFRARGDLTPPQVACCTDHSSQMSHFHLTTPTLPLRLEHPPPGLKPDPDSVFPISRVWLRCPAARLLP